MRRIGKQVRANWNALWRGIRQWSGDAAYETYAQCAARSGKSPQLSASEFYVEQLNRKYSGPSRCC